MTELYLLNKSNLLEDRETEKSYAIRKPEGLNGWVFMAKSMFRTLPDSDQYKGGLVTDMKSIQICISDKSGPQSKFNMTEDQKKAFVSENFMKVNREIEAPSKSFKKGSRQPAFSNEKLEELIKEQQKTNKILNEILKKLPGLTVPETAMKKAGQILDEVDGSEIMNEIKEDIKETPGGSPFKF